MLGPRKGAPGAEVDVAALVSGKSTNESGEDVRKLLEEVQVSELNFSEPLTVQRKQFPTRAKTTPSSTSASSFPQCKLTN